ncbi:hypothetical protein PAXINDRAFT_14145 [Paxillus involutus ATCC 200175]|uniref:Uncharacterized protein n=1 Tax=Paxillus involutus ATCC 200175 TaxID=664439 RepID=A0A0C9TRR4_PAXIN|nr:hypothetical protein PAXINDRAFT_14145 [Paxillus involutus ATCC 200175]
MYYNAEEEVRERFSSHVGMNHPAVNLDSLASDLAMGGLLSFQTTQVIYSSPMVYPSVRNLQANQFRAAPILHPSPLQDLATLFFESLNPLHTVPAHTAILESLVDFIIEDRSVSFARPMWDKPGGTLTSALFSIARKLGKGPELLKDSRPLQPSVPLMGITGDFTLRASPNVLAPKRLCPSSRKLL